MSNSTNKTRSVRLSVPRRSKNQLYMNILPYLPDFAAIIRTIQKNRAIDKAAKKSEEKLQKVQSKRAINVLLMSPQKINQSQETRSPANFEQKQASEVTVKCEPKSKKICFRGTKRSTQIKRTRKFFPKEGKKRDQMSFTMFNSIEEYFL